MASGQESARIQLWHRVVGQGQSLGLWFAMTCGYFISARAPGNEGAVAGLKTGFYR